MMHTFEDILSHAKPKRIFVSPHPSPPLGRALDDVKKAGHDVIVGNDFSSTGAKDILRGFEQGEWDIFMQGDVPLKHVFELLEAWGVKRNQLGFVSLFEDKIRSKLLFVVDTYVQNNPSFKDKMMLLEMTIDLARALGVEAPQVAVLSALETVNPAMVSSIEAAALSKMSERGQFSACVEGPLDIDSALCAVAARRKGVSSPVPGEVDILLCPDVESANALSRFLSGLGRLPAAGVLLGTPLPVVIHPSLISMDHKLVEVAIASIKGEFKP